MLSWGCRRLEISWGWTQKRRQHCVSKAWSTYTNTHTYVYTPQPPPPQSLPIGLVCGYTWPILHTCQHCVSKAWSTHTNTHIFIYIYRDLHPGSIGAFLGLPEAWNQLGVNTETPPRTPVTSTPYMSALCEQGMIYLHKHTHICIHVQTFVMGGSLFSCGCRKLEVSWGWTLRNASPNPTPPPPESTNWTCLWVYMTNTPYMSALREQGMIYLHKHTHIYIYIDLHPASIGAFLGLPEAWNQLGVNTETPPRTPVASTPYMSALCEQGMIYLHKHTHTYIYTCTDLRHGGIAAFLGLPEAWNQLGMNT